MLVCPLALPCMVVESLTNAVVWTINAFVRAPTMCTVRPPHKAAKDIDEGLVARLQSPRPEHVDPHFIHPRVASLGGGGGKG